MEASFSTSDFAPGSIKAVQLGSEPVAVANVEGAFYAFGDTCTHRGCSLAEGILAGTEVECHCHGGRFDIRTGEVLGGPPRDPVKAYQVSVSNGNLTISG